MKADDLLVFGGSASSQLTAKICEYLGIKPGRNETLRFSEGNLFVRILENVRGRHVFIVQSTVFTPNDHFVELLFWIDAFRRASAASVTAVVPFFSYAKGDKKDEPRVSIRARVCADCLEAAGAARLLTMDLNPPQIQGFFRVPVDALYALPVFCEKVRREELENLVVVSPDAGFVKPARRYARHLGVGLAIGDKERSGHDERAEVLDIIGEVKGKTALVVDDFTISGNTLVQIAQKLVERGAREVWAVVTHGALVQGAVERIDASPIHRLLITDTVEGQPVEFSRKIEVVSVAPLFGEAIRRIHRRESISVLFPQ